MPATLSVNAARWREMCSSTADFNMGKAELGERVDDGVDDDTECRGDAAFAAAAKPQRMRR